MIVTVGFVDVPAVAVAFEAVEASFVGRAIAVAAAAAAISAITATEAVVLRVPVVVIVVLVTAVVLSVAGLAPETVEGSVANELAAVGALVRGLSVVPFVAETVTLVVTMSSELNSY